MLKTTFLEYNDANVKFFCFKFNPLLAYLIILQFTIAGNQEFNETTLLIPYSRLLESHPLSVTLTHNNSQVEIKKTNIEEISRFILRFCIIKSINSIVFESAQWFRKFQLVYLSLRCRVGTGCPKNGTITPQGVGKKT